MNYDFQFKGDTNSAAVKIGRFTFNLYFEHGTVTECLVETDKTKYEHGFDVTDLRDIAIKVNGDYVSVHDLIADIEANYDSFVAEYEQDCIDEERMQDELSSPYLSGRV